ncbi:hypothetical protein B0A48_02551 [Cryoendolithus antarcticus]|uniref:Uncharacterized protein n=1 Tax=Cryoendolithus antarcticus TaxID=1507870 RepID=A0A1V8TNZ3_9PEZI|nr:hypothetical protein B0A48_02551 [Cryoendolithus antarcticus]
MEADNTSYAMMYTYWPPAMHGGKHPDDCGDAGSVYLHIGFGVVAPTNIDYTLSNETCTRGLRQVYSRDCGWDITDNKQGGQLDLGSYFKQGNDPNDTYNDHLFYLADPNPPLPSRNRFYSNLEPFVPNAEDTYTFDTFYDPCYEVHEGYGGDDFWFRDPLEWTAKGVGWKEHNRDKDDCVRKGWIYDKRGGTRDNDGRKDGQ